MKSQKPLIECSRWIFLVLTLFAHGMVAQAAPRPPSKALEEVLAMVSPKEKDRRVTAGDMINATGSYVTVNSIIVGFYAGSNCGGSFLGSYSLSGPGAGTKGFPDNGRLSLRPPSAYSMATDQSISPAAVQTVAVTLGDNNGYFYCTSDSGGSSAPCFNVDCSVGSSCYTNDTPLNVEHCAVRSK